MKELKLERMYPVQLGLDIHTEQKEGDLKICPICGKEFKGPRKDSKYCSKKCATKGHRRIKLGYPLSNKDNLVEKICPVCGKKFTSIQKNAKCCSTGCFNKMYYRANRGLPVSDIKYKKYKDDSAEKDISVKNSECNKGVERVCACGKKFIAKSKKHIYCSRQCNLKFNYIKRDNKIKQIINSYNKSKEEPVVKEFKRSKLSKLFRFLSKLF